MSARRVEKHIVTKNNRNYKSIDYLCFMSKNLYNYTNYVIRQSFLHSGLFINENELISKFRTRNNFDYYNMCGNTNQFCVKQLFTNWKSFFKAIKSYKNNSDKFLGKPKMPAYKAKNGRNLVTFTYNDARIKNGYLFVNKKANLLPIKTNVKSNQLKQVRLIPQSSCYVIEIIYEVELQDLNLEKENYLSIDLGIDNFATCYDSHANRAFIINGKIIKSINQYFNKKKSLFMSYIGNKGTSNRINSLILKRNNKINNYLHNSSKYIIDYCVKNNIGTIIIGHNKSWKQKANIGKINNQKFVQIPFNTFIRQLQYKAENINITYIITEENYTSKVDHLANESLCHHDNYLGKRIKRGLFKSSTKKVLNADLNGAIGILRKAINESSFKKIIDRGFVINPVKVNPLTKTII